MNPKVHDFPALIRWIAEKYHDGAVYPIHERVGVAPATVQLWATGGTQNPSLGNLDRLCTAYDLDFDFVRRLLRRARKVVPISGGSDGIATQVVDFIKNDLSLIRRWLVRTLVPWARPLLPSPVFA